MSDQNNQFGNSNKCFSKAEPRETVEMRCETFFAGFLIFWSCWTRILYTIKVFGENFSRPFYVSFSYVSFIEKMLNFTIVTA